MSVNSISKVAPEGLIKIVKQSLEDLCSSDVSLQDYVVEVASILIERQAKLGDVDKATVIGFSGGLLKGSLVSLTSNSFLSASHPNVNMGMAVNEVDMKDWAGELSNQILGRIKNRLASIDIKFDMSTPTVVVGKDMVIDPPKTGCAFGLNLCGSHGKVNIFFLAVIDDKANFDKESSTTCATEGDALLF